MDYLTYSFLVFLPQTWKRRTQTTAYEIYNAWIIQWDLSFWSEKCLKWFVKEKFGLNDLQLSSFFATNMQKTDTNNGLRNLQRLNHSMRIREMFEMICKRTIWVMYLGYLTYCFFSSLFAANMQNTDKDNSLQNLQSLNSSQIS